MKNKSGFISMALVYSFLIIFLFLMTAIIKCYSQKNLFMEAIRNKVDSDLGTNNKGKKTLINTIVNDNNLLSIVGINFNNISSDLNGKGFYYIDNDDISNGNDYHITSRIYFYRGNVNNNFVVFGNEFERYSSPIETTNAGTTTIKYINTDTSKYMCWRIIHTNDDNSVKLLYYGYYDTSNDRCVSKNGIGVYNATELNQSESIAFLNNWLENNTNLSNVNTLVSEKVNGEKVYEYSCLNDYLSNSNVEILTADEVIMAGGKYNTANSNYYLKENYSYWTMSLDESSDVYIVNEEGKLIASPISSENIYIRPLINLKGNVLVNSGLGLNSDPYFLINVE